MKPNKKQLDAIKTIQTITGYWSLTNDIHSLSHCALIEGELSSIDDIPEGLKKDLTDKLVDIWQIVRAL